MKIAYIAGPYRAKTKLGIICNILKVRKVAMELWRMGYTVVCPHLNSALMDGIVPDEVFLRRGVEILKRCDLLVLLPDWEKSKGAMIEREKACGMMPVFFWPRHKKVLEVEVILKCN